MDRYIDERDFLKLTADRYTFAVLSRILRSPCSCILTDHDRFILCHSASPYPVWLWTPDHISAEEKEQAWRLASQTLPLSEGYRYNLKYELAEYFIARAQEAGLQAAVSTNLFAYDCPAAITPSAPADGYLHICTEDDTDEVADLLCQFHADIGDAPRNREADLLKARQYIGNKAFFLWKNAAGDTVACCSYNPDGALGCLGSVYTKPAHRRRHYAQHMVYQVTKLVESRGLTPMLYTDADYAASNACYEKIGYLLRGKLCTISAQ